MKEENDTLEFLKGMFGMKDEPKEPCKHKWIFDARGGVTCTECKLRNNPSK